MSRFFYVIVKPGNDLDGEDYAVTCESREEADRLASERGRVLRAELRLVGYRETSYEPFQATMPLDELPWWAQDLVAEANAIRARRSA